MDEFLRDINAEIYFKWILLQGSKYNLTIKLDDYESNVIVISNKDILGKIIYYGNGLFEEVLVNRYTSKKIFYLHFQLTHLNHAVELFRELIDCALEVTVQPQVKILLCCSGGLSTTLFASKMMELVKLKNLPYKIEASSYVRLYEIGEDYDIVMLAPQVSYMLPQVMHNLKNKPVVTIPTRIFATNDFSNALKLISDWYESSFKV